MDREAEEALLAFRARVKAVREAHGLSPERRWPKLAKGIDPGG